MNNSIGIISVVIPTYNRLPMLRRTLDCVVNQDLPPNMFEVIVVVDGSTDGTVDWLRGFKPHVSVQFLVQPNSGQSVARNAGARTARGRFLYFVDDDILVPPSVLRQHLEAHQSPGLLVTFGPIRMCDESVDGVATDFARDWIDAYFGRLMKARTLAWYDGVLGPNSLIRREDFFGVHGYDESFPRYREDTDLGLRLKQAGIHFEFLPQAVTFQVFVKTARDLLRDTVGQASVEARFCERHPGHRRVGALSNLAQGTFLQRWGRRLLSLDPGVIYRGALIAVHCLSPFRRQPCVRSLAKRILQLGVTSVFYREAARIAGSWADLVRSFGVRLPVLLYHGVGPAPPGAAPGTWITERQFEDDLKWLAAHGYVSIRSSDWLAWCLRGTPLPRRPVLLCFDDAFSQCGDCALPLLQRYGYTAMIFIVSGCLGGANLWDSGDGWAKVELMDAEQVRNALSRNHEIGAHSISHVDLTQVPADVLKDEVEGCVRQLGHTFKTSVRTFAYPYGAYNDSVVAAVSRACDVGFTVDEGVNTLQTDLLLLKRMVRDGHDVSRDLWFRFNFGTTPLRNLRLRLKAVTTRGWFRSITNS